MTKTEAVRSLLTNVTISAQIIDQRDAFNFDQSSTNYIPDPIGLAVLEALVGRKIGDGELNCQLGLGPRSTCYSITEELLKEVTFDEIAVVTM
jgi:hypothetical protein